MPLEILTKTELDVAPTDPEDLARKAEVDELDDRLDHLEGLGSFVGSFATFATLPTLITALPTGTSVNDFATVRADETQANTTTRYIITAIAPGPTPPVGTLTWTFDIRYSTDITGKQDNLPATGTQLRYLLSQVASQAAGVAPLWRDARTYLEALGDLTPGAAVGTLWNKVFRNIADDPRFPVNFGTGAAFASAPGAGQYTMFVYTTGGRVWFQQVADGNDITLAGWLELAAVGALQFRPLSPDLYNWIPIGTAGGLYVGEGSGVANAPSAGWWKFIAVNQEGVAGLSILALSPNAPAGLFMRTRTAAGTWSAWKEFVGQNEPMLYAQNIELDGALYTTGATSLTINRNGQVFDQGYRVYSYHNEPPGRFFPLVAPPNASPTTGIVYVYGIPIAPNDILFNATPAPLMIAGANRAARTLWRVIQRAPLQVAPVGTTA